MEWKSGEEYQMTTDEFTLSVYVCVTDDGEGWEWSATRNDDKRLTAFDCYFATADAAMQGAEKWLAKVSAE